MHGFYIHIPFCVRKCLYCDFYSLPMAKGPPSKLLHTDSDNTAFLDALALEFKQLPSDFAPQTIFIGGGTPTELSDADFERLLRMIRETVDISRVTEWTCESNPGTLTPTKARLMRDAGVNRVSLGVQSFTPRALEFLGRIHSTDEAKAGYRLLREHGFDNINLDLMYGIPGFTLNDVANDLDALIELNPDHTSCYCLIFEDGTPLTELRNKGYVREVDDDTELEQYKLVRQKLADAGYAHYEISNFAKPGRECRHNLLYWGSGEYIGCGPSAHSHWKGTRYGNVRSLSGYCEKLVNNESVRHFEEKLEPEHKARETLIMELRRREGVTNKKFFKDTGYDLQTLCGEKINWLKNLNLLEEIDGYVRLTDQGLFLSDGVFSELI